MILTFMLDEVGRVGTLTTDGILSEDMQAELTSALDPMLFTMCQQGWTILIGARGQPPRILDPQQIMIHMAMRARQRFDQTPTSVQVDPAPTPAAETPQDPNRSPEEKRADLFRSWAPGEPDPSSGPPKPSEEPPEDDDEQPDPEDWPRPDMA
jgi:hypothetical protein